MNWDAIGATGEVLGAIAVVATLIYLAIQIRENTRASKSEAFRDSVALWNDVFEMLASADSKIVMKALVSYQSLEGHEKHQFETLMIAALTALETQLDILGHEFMDEDDFLSVEGFLRRYFAYEGTQQWWKSGRESCAPIVKAWIDERFPAPDPHYDHWGIRAAKRS